MKSYILLENVEFYAYHGVLPQERSVGNVFIVNLKLEIDLLHACTTDSLSDTLSYAALYAIVEEEMRTPSRLLEHAAYRIVQRLTREYPQILHFELKLSKRNPPMGAKLDAASILLIG